MHAFDRTAVRDLLILSLAAGSADAVGFLGLGQVFTCNMTGNVVLLGIALGQGHRDEIVKVAAVIVAFLLGAVLGTWRGRRVEAKNWPMLVRRVIGMEAVLLIAFAFGWCLLPFQDPSRIDLTLTVLLTLAMGVQASAMHRLSIPGAGTTAVTGTLTSFATGAIQAFSRPSVAGEKISSRSRIVFQALVVGLYCGGAAVSGTLILNGHFLAGFVPPLLVLLVVFCHRKGER